MALSVTVIGLGYVGLPLAVALAKHFETTGFDVDTRHCTCNYPPAFSIEGARLGQGEQPGDDTHWQPVVPITPLGPSRHHFIAHEGADVWTHLRLHIYPDGGIARAGLAQRTDKRAHSRFSAKQIEALAVLVGHRPALRPVAQGLRESHDFH